LGVQGGFPWVARRPGLGNTVAPPPTLYAEIGVRVIRGGLPRKRSSGQLAGRGLNEGGPGQYPARSPFVAPRGLSSGKGPGDGLKGGRLFDSGIARVRSSGLGCCAPIWTRARAVSRDVWHFIVGVPVGGGSCSTTPSRLTNTLPARPAAQKNGDGPCGKKGRRRFLGVCRG